MYQITIKDKSPLGLELTGDFWGEYKNAKEAEQDAKQSYAEELNTTPENIEIIKTILAIK